MLQNHYKGTDFSPNNQKKNTEKIINLMIFLNLGWVQNAEIINIVIAKICQWWHFLWSSTLKNGIYEE